MWQNTIYTQQQQQHARTYFLYNVNVLPHGSIQMRGLFHEEEFVSLKTVLEWNIASNEKGNMTIQLLKALPPFGHAGLLYIIRNIKYNSHSCSDHVLNPLWYLSLFVHKRLNIHITAKYRTSRPTMTDNWKLHISCSMSFF